MKTLEELGIKTKRCFVTESSSTDLGGIEVSSSTKESTQLTLTLPQAAPISATFSTEGLAHKVVKIFKSELQTGDQEFDEAVYIATQTPEQTSHVLQSPEVRAMIRGLLVHGPVTINGLSATMTVGGHEKGEDATVARLMNALIR